MSRGPSTRILKRRFLFVGGGALFFAGAAFLSLLATNTTSFAAPWGRAATYGYFDNNSSDALTPYPDSRGPVLPNNDYEGGETAIPSSVNTTDDFYNFLRSRYNSTQDNKYLTTAQVKAWNKTGVGFIVNTMLGRNGSAANRTVTAADWKALKDRLDFLATYGSVSFGANVDTSSSPYFNVNTYYQFPNNDVAWYIGGTEVEPGIVFSYKGTVVYALLYSCANPLGDLPGLPDVSYDLTPSVNTDHAKNGVVSPADTVKVMPSVDNTGSSDSIATDWQLSQFIVPPGGSYPTGTKTSNQAPAAYYGNGLKTLDSGTQVFKKGPIPVGQVGGYDETIPDEPSGTKICYALSIHGYDQSSKDWRHSDPFCVIIGKKPMVQIWGGDLVAGAAFTGQTPTAASIDTSTTSKSDGKTYGSWVEYGVFAPSSITIASLSGLSGGNSSSKQVDWSKLTFANQPSQYCPAGTKQYGCYNSVGSMGNIPDVESYFFTASTPDTPGSLNLAQGAGVHTYKHTGDLVINAATIQKGQSYVIKATGNVTITGDIAYTSSKLSSLADIPQLVIIANNIYINSNVSNVDAWLIAEGTTASNTGILDTCHISTTYATALSSSICNTALRVNGPVMAQHVWLRRTAGADKGAASGDPAEIFNLRSDAYLWAFNQVQGGGKAETAYTKELPPRF